jgi:hypothetical protein
MRAESGALWAEPTAATDERRSRTKSDRTHLLRTVAASSAAPWI